MITKVFILILLMGPAGFAGIQAFDPYEYRPVDREFWTDMQSSLKELNYGRVIRLSEKKFKTAKKDSLEYAEATVTLGQALSRAGITFGSTLVLVEVIKNKLGTQTAMQALTEIEEISKKYSIDEEFIYGEVINDLEFDSLTPKLQDFVSFQQGMFNLLKGYNKWSDEDFKKVSVDSYWDFKLKYLTALGEVARNRIDSAVERFSTLSSNQQTPADIKNEATHQYGRLIFEKGDYPQAYKIFKGVTLNPREKGLILIERAWAKYYQKDYSKALGLLSALEAPMFDTARSPEPYILRMLMFKELCYFESAFQVLGNFNLRFGQSLKAIKKRQDLRKDQMLVNLAVLDRRVEKWVNYLNLLKDEKANLREYGWDSYSFYKDMVKKYDQKIKEVNDRLNWILLDKTREVGNQLLDWDEQLVFLDYQTRLDSLRVVRPAGEVNFKAEEIPHMSFDKMYWESSGEFWIDELENYKVAVESKCGDGGKK